MNEYETKIVDPEEFVQNWGLIAPLLQRALRATEGEIALEDLYKFIVNKQVVLFAALRKGKLESVMAVEIGEFPRYKVARIIAVGGSNLNDAFETSWRAFENWALAMDCIAIEGWVKEAQWRLYRRQKLFEPVYRVIRRSLRGRLQ